MAWQVNRKTIAAGFADLKYLPPTRGVWDATLACLTICLDRLLAQLGDATSLEIFATLYACVRPRDALVHQAIFDLIDRRCTSRRRPNRRPLFRAAAAVPV